MVEPILVPDASAEPAAYVQALIDALGDREPIAVYGQTADGIAVLCADLDQSAWHEPLGPGEWSAYALVGHLLDVDIVYGFRWRLVLTEDRPTYPGYNEKAWAGLPKPPLDDLLKAFRALRRTNLALIQAIPPKDWQRQGIHGEQGQEDIERMIGKIAGHDLVHLNQLRRTVEHALAGQPNSAKGSVP